MKTLLQQFKAILRESSLGSLLPSTSTNMNAVSSQEQELLLITSGEPEDLRSKYFACLDENSWLAARYLDLQERYERLLINYNKLSDIHPHG